MQSRRTTEESTDRGVSPVIGVILMVAITVILAAVIAAFVLDIGPSDTDPTAAIDIEGDEVTLQSIDQGEGILVFEEDESGDISDEEIVTVTGNSATIDGHDYVLAFDGEREDLTELGDDDDLDNLVDDFDGTIVVVEEL